MQGMAYGVASDGSTVALLDVEFPSLGGKGERLSVACEPRYGRGVAEAIGTASEWGELPTVTFEEWQVVGEGR